MLRDAKEMLLAWLGMATRELLGWMVAVLCVLVAVLCVLVAVLCVLVAVLCVLAAVRDHHTARRLAP